MTRLWKVSLATVLTALQAGSCQTDNVSETKSVEPVNKDTVTVNDHALLDKLKTLVVQNEPYREELITAGVVKAIPTQYAEIAPAFKGRVTRSFLKLGMKTLPETPLFEVSSPDFIAAQKVFFQEKSQLEQAQKNLQRQKDLVAHGVGVQKELEEAETAFEVEKKEYENAAAGIRIFKADPNSIVLGQPLVVRAPIAGEVIENKVVMGAFINDDATSVATVANLSKIWIAGQVKEKDIRHIRKLDECTISIAAFPEKIIHGKVYHVNDIVDENSRSIEVLIEADNADHILKPGMYVTVNFWYQPAPTILVPSRALLQWNDNNYVYVEVAPNVFVKRMVGTGETLHEKVVVRSGLSAGEKIIAEGGFYLPGTR